jgi:chromosome partitioning protein
MRKTIAPQRQIILWVTANAGGVGKTTLGAHIGYRFAQMGLNVLFIDLDTNGSIAKFCGLEPQVEVKDSSAALFERVFDGRYPAFTPEWGIPSGRFDVCPGGDVMVSVALDLPTRTGRETVLKRSFQKFPPNYDLVILDSPASLDVLSASALAASSHILIPLPMSVKMVGVDSLLQWINNTQEDLGLSPVPKLLGCVPMRVEDNADQRSYAESIASALEGMGIHCFPKVRYSAEFQNAANRGIAPLYRYRPGHKACNDFEPIVEALAQEFSREVVYA